MSSEVQKIRQEIERLKMESLEGKKDYYDYYDGVGDAYDEILQFIDSLPEEHASEDLEKEIGKYTTNHLLKKRNHSTGVYHLTQKDCDDIARHFAEWQKRQMMENTTNATVYEGLFNKYIKEQDKNALLKALANFKDGDKVKIIIVKEE